MTNYANGVRLERLVKELLQGRGYTVVRAAGSHGPVDLVAFNAHELRLIQVKARGACRPADKNKLVALARPTNAALEIWERGEGGCGWIIQERNHYQTQWVSYRVDSEGGQWPL